MRRVSQYHLIERLPMDTLFVRAPLPRPIDRKMACGLRQRSTHADEPLCQEVHDALSIPTLTHPQSTQPSLHLYLYPDSNQHHLELHSRPGAILATNEEGRKDTPAPIGHEVVADAIRSRIILAPRALY